MLFFIYTIFIQGIKIHPNSILSNSLVSKENDLCPTYYPGLYIKSNCQSFGKNYTTGSAEPAYRADSRETGFTITLDHCNYSKYVVSSGFFFSLININGSRTVKLNVNSCRFIDNEMVNTETGVFFLSNGPHQAAIDECTFINNRGKKNSILGETCAKLTMSNCYFAHNIANDRKGQIHVTALNNGKADQILKTNDECQLSFSNLVFYLNLCWPVMNENSIMLIDGYTSISFKNCSFTFGNGESKNMIGLKGKNIEISFTDCCFFVNYSAYFNYYHIYFDTGATGHATFSGKNSFSGSKQNAINKNIAETDEEVYNIDKCYCEFEEPTQTLVISAPTEMETLEINTPTEIETSVINTLTINPSSSEITQSLSDLIPTSSPTSSLTQSSSDGGGDSDSGCDDRCKDRIVLSIPFIVLFAVLALFLIIIAFIIGWYSSKKYYEAEDDQNPLKSDLLFSQQD